MTNMDSKESDSTKIAKVTRKRLMDSLLPKNTRDIIRDATPILVKAIERKDSKKLFSNEIQKKSQNFQRDHSYRVVRNFKNSMY